MRASEPNIKTAAELGVRVEGRPALSALIGAAYPLDGLILTEGDLGPEVFRLASGLAGDLFQKLVNYRVPTALVLPDFAAHGERFAELAREHARHREVRFVQTVEEARAWLESGG